MKRILTKELIITGLFLTSLFCLAEVSAQTKQGTLKFDTRSQKFKTIDQGAIINFDFPFENTGNAPVIISDVKVTCGCSAPEWPKQPIPPGGRDTIKVEFNSTGKWGWQEKQVKVVSNASNNGVVLTFKGKVNKIKEGEK